MSPLIDDRGRLFGRLNILDILVLLLIVALAVFAFTRVRDQQVASFKVRITLVGEKGVRQPTIDGVKVGQTVSDDSGNVLGKVESFKVTPTPEEAPDWLGHLQFSLSPIYKDLAIVVVGTAQGSAKSLRIGYTPLRIGRPVQAIGPNWEVKTAIWGVEVVKP